MVALVLLVLLLPLLATALLNNLGMVAVHRAMGSPLPSGPAMVWDAQEAPVCLDQGQCLRARDLLSLGTQMGLADGRVWKTLGLVALLQRDLPAAGEALERVGPESGQRRTARFLLGYRHELDGDRAQAVAAWREADAGRYFADGKPAVQVLAPRPPSWERALASAQLAADIDEHGVMYGRIATLYVDLGNRARNGRPADAVAAFQRALEFAPSRMDLHVSLAQVYRSTGERDKAEAEYRQAVERGSGAVQIQAYRELAQLSFDQQRVPQAIEDLRTAVAQHPENGELGLLLGEALRRSGDLVAAAAVWRRVTLLPSTPWQAQAFDTLGQFYEGQKQLGEAEAAYREAAGRVQGVNEYHLRWAGVLYRQQRGAEAEAVLRDVVQRGNANLQVAALVTLAQWSLEQRRPDDAAATYRDALRVAPTNADVHLRLAGVLQGLSRLDEAETELRQATTSPDRNWQVQAYGALGAFYEQQRRWSQAVIAYQAALVRQPKNADVKNRLRISNFEFRISE